MNDNEVPWLFTVTLRSGLVFTGAGPNILTEWNHHRRTWHGEWRQLSSLCKLVQWPTTHCNHLLILSYNYLYIWGFSVNTKHAAYSPVCCKCDCGMGWQWRCLVWRCQFAPMRLKLKVHPHVMPPPSPINSSRPPLDSLSHTTFMSQAWLKERD